MSFYQFGKLNKTASSAVASHPILIPIFNPFLTTHLCSLWAQAGNHRVCLHIPHHATALQPSRHSPQINSDMRKCCCGLQLCPSGKKTLLLKHTLVPREDYYRAAKPWHRTVQFSWLQSTTFPASTGARRGNPHCRTEPWGPAAPPPVIASPCSE